MKVWTSNAKEAAVEINWNDEKSPISRHFTVREALWLPTWGRLANETDGLDDRIRGEIVGFAKILDLTRDATGAEFVVHCWYRPLSYNILARGAKHSAHMCEGAWSACDFHVKGYDGVDGCAEIRAMIRPNLSALNLRLEDIVGPWVHVDNRPPFEGQPRFFKP